MNEHRSRFDFSGAAVPSAEDVKRLIRASQDPDVRRRAPQLLTSVNHLARFAGRVLAAIPFTVKEVNRIVTQANAQAHGLAPGTLANTRSNLDFIFDHFRLGGLRRLKAELSPECAELWEELGERARWPLSRFLRFLSARGCRVADVDDATLAAFEQALRDNSVTKAPRDLVRDAKNTWNAAADRLPHRRLQKLSIKPLRQPWGIREREFPAGLAADVERYFARLTAEDDFDVCDLSAPERRLKPATVKCQREWFFLLATAAVRAGTPIESLTSLTALASPAVFGPAARWLAKERGFKPSIANIVDMGRKAAKYISKLPPEDVAVVEKVAANFKRRVAKEPKLDRRAQRMRPFEDNRNLHRIVALSAFVRGAVERKARRRRRPSLGDALLIRNALIHELLLVTSLRRRNLAQLDLVRHVVPHPSGRGFARLEIEGRDVKNELTIVRELPPHAEELLQLYLKVYRPFFAPSGASPWLFPGEQGGHIHLGSLTQQYKAS